MNGRIKTVSVLWRKAVPRNKAQSVHKGTNNKGCICSMYRMSRKNEQV